MPEIKFLIYSFFVINSLNYAVGQIIQPRKNVICYIPREGFYGGSKTKFTVEDVDPDLCTHLIYTYLSVSEITNKTIGGILWREDGYGQLQIFKDLKEKNPNVKLLVNINEHLKDLKFSNMAKSSESRSAFIECVYDFLKKHQIDGIEITWLYGVYRNGVTEDTYVSLLKELREKLGREYLLSVLITVGRDMLLGYDVKAISDVVDLMNIKWAFQDYYEPWEMKNGIKSARTPQTERNLDFAINYFLQQDANPSKMMPALHTKGFTYNETSLRDGIYFRPPIDRGFTAPFTRHKGVIGYYEVCYLLSTTSGWKEMWHEETKTAFAVNNNKMITFDNPRSLTEKVKLINEKNLGGAIVWKLDTDDFKGLCGTKYPLLNAISNQLIKERRSKLYTSTVISHAYR